MKIIFSALTLVLALSAVTTAQASDRKIGNVIAVERTISNIYETCIDQLKEDQTSGQFVSCKIDVKKTNADYTQGTQRVLFLYKDGCEVEGYAQNSVALITFSATTPKATLNDAKACLRKAIDTSANKDSFKILIYTVE